MSPLLLERAKAGDVAARENLLKEYANFVRHIAFKHYRPGAFL